MFLGRIIITDQDAVLQLPCAGSLCQGWREVRLGFVEEGIVKGGEIDSTTWTVSSEQNVDQLMTDVLCTYSSACCYLLHIS